MDLSGNKCDISERSTGHAPGSRLADFDPFACFCFWMTVTIMIDGRVKRNRKFGLKLQSSHVIVKRYNLLAKN